MSARLEGMPARLSRAAPLYSEPDARRPWRMTRVPELPRGVAISRRIEAPPWRASLGAQASVLIAVRGSFYVSVGEHVAIPLDAGDVALVEASEPGSTVHGVAGPDRAPPELIVASYEPTPALGASARVLRLLGSDVAREPGLAAVVGLLRAALTEPSAPRSRIARSLTGPLLAYALAAHEGAASAPHDPRIARALDLLRSRPAERWTVEALAKAAGMSRAAFARRFLAEIGSPPLRKLAEIRMDIAAEQLALTDASLASIAAEVGYESEFAFGRAFKRAIGEAPGVYRRRSRSEGAALRPPTIRAAA